jgi:hypothetical protein
MLANAEVGIRAPSVRTVSTNVTPTLAKTRENASTASVGTFAIALTNGRVPIVESQ